MSKSARISGDVPRFGETSTSVQRLLDLRVAKEPLSDVLVRCSKEFHNER
jgi:hypothetical protein